VKQRTGDPWMPAARYGRELPTFTVNLLVRDVPRAAGFYTKIFAATITPIPTSRPSTSAASR